jgi:CheY-like chemotaxis protein
MSENTKMAGDVSLNDRQVRVLVVEDNPDDRDLLLRQLRKSGMDTHVKFITNGQEAFDFLNRPDFALSEKLIAVFLDLRLPGISGIELLQHVRQRDDLRAIPVIVMTSSINPKDLDECRRLQVTNFVAKPVTYSSFSKAVADVFHSPKVDVPLPLGEP